MITSPIKDLSPFCNETIIAFSSQSPLHHNCCNSVKTLTVTFPLQLHDNFFRIFYSRKNVAVTVMITMTRTCNVKICATQRWLKDLSRFFFNFPRNECSLFIQEDSHPFESHPSTCRITITGCSYFLSWIFKMQMTLIQYLGYIYTLFVALFCLKQS